MPQQIVFHIGLEKTGTTSLQHYLTHNADAMRSVGLFYPTESAGFLDGQHSRLVAGYLPRDMRSFADAEMSREDLVSSVTNEIARAGLRTAILSSEFFSSRMEALHIEQLRHDFSAFECRILVVVRPHFERLVSAYSSAILSGSRQTLEEFTLALLDPPAESIFHSVLHRYPRYADTLRPWERSFPGAVKVIVFPSDGDVIRTFIGALRPDVAQAISPTDRKNKSLTPGQLDRIRAINQSLPLYEELHAAGELDRWPDVCRERQEAINRVIVQPTIGASNLNPLSKATQQRLKEIIAIDRSWLSELYAIDLAEPPEKLF